MPRVPQHNRPYVARSRDRTTRYPSLEIPTHQSDGAPVDPSGQLRILRKSFELTFPGEEFF